MNNRADIAFAFAFGAALLLAGCDDAAPTVETAESVDACIQRWEKSESFAKASDLFAGHSVAAIYTFDVSELPIGKLRDLTAGRGMSGTLVDSTGSADDAVRAFMDRDVDEKGALLFAEDKIIYRTRLPNLVGKQVIGHGCELQKSGMRLIRIDRLLNKKLHA